MTETKPEFKLKNPPEDGISRVTFGPHSSQFLLVSSWDKKVHIFCFYYYERSDWIKL